MHYLKCSSCGHLNEVNNGNQIFCSSCNRRLDNNFFSWQKDNPEKNLDDFKRLMCVSDEDLQQANAKTKQSPKGMKYWLSFIVGTLLLYVVGHFGGEYIVNFFKSEKTSKEVMEKTWFSETYGDFGLVVETPVKMTKSELSLPPNISSTSTKWIHTNTFQPKGLR